MADHLLHQRCVACQGGEPQLTADEITALKPQVADWAVMTVDGHPSLVKTFHFKDFVGSITFVDKVKDVAETEAHHPDLHIHWNTVRVENWTHATGGLHQNDFILAAKINALETSVDAKA